MKNEFLNPLELFQLTDTPAGLLTPDLLRNRKRRFLSEMELDEKDSFTYHGREYTRNDLDRAVAEATMPEGLALFHAAGKAVGLSAFLVSGKIPAPGAVSLKTPALRPLLDTCLTETYPRALRNAIIKKNWVGVGELLRWKPHELGFSPVVMYAGLDEYLQLLIPDFLDIFKRYSCDIAHVYAGDFKIPRYKAKHWIRGLRLFSVFLPKPLADNLPEYAAPHINQLVAGSIPYLKTMFKGAETRLAHKIAGELLGLPHLEPEHKEVLEKMRRDNRVSGLDELLPSDLDSPFRYIGQMLIFMAFILGFVLLLVEAKRDPMAEKEQARKEREWKVFYEEQSALLRERTGFYLRAQQVTGRQDFTMNFFSLREVLPDELIAKLRTPPITVQTTNQVLAYFDQDTIPHVNGVITNPEDYILSRPVEEIEAIRKRVQPNDFIDTAYLDARILELRQGSPY